MIVAEVSQSALRRSSVLVGCFVSVLLHVSLCALASCDPRGVALLLNEATSGETGGEAGSVSGVARLTPQCFCPTEPYESTPHSSITMGWVASAIEGLSK